MNTAPLDVQGFGRRYRRRGRWAVRGMSLTLVAGSIAALVGPNGAGKSTLVRACVGFEPPDEGRILVDGHDSVTDRARAVAASAYVAQSASLYRSLTIGDHLTMAEEARASFDRGLALERLESTGLNERRRVGELSGGEQAQVALALALGTRAPLLLLDEPLASLDPLARRDFMEVLRHDVRARQATVLVSSHIVTEVEPVCDRVVLIADGRVLLDVTIEESRRRFVALPAEQLNGRRAIGVFAGGGGELLALMDEPGYGRAASLEEVVIGHLAGNRVGSTAG